MVGDPSEMSNCSRTILTLVSYNFSFETVRQNFCKADANADANANAGAEMPMPMPRFPNGPWKFMTI